MKNHRIALLTNIPRPYRIPLFDNLNDAIHREGGELHVYFYSNPSKHARRRGSNSAPGHFSHTALKSLEFSLGYERLMSIPISLGRALHQYHPDLLISGAFGIPGFLGWLYTCQHRIPYVQWSGATLHREGQGGFFSAFTQSFLVRHATACIAYGNAACEYLVKAGGLPAKVVVGVNAVDNLFFLEKADQARKELEAFKNIHHLQGINFLYVGNLVPLKGLYEALNAFAQLRKEGQFHFHLVGKGPEEERLRHRAIQLGLENQIHFWGTQPPERVPFYYALADVFVFPSLYDVWGLVLNEAMACGLPVIASSIAGATRDLVVDGENGFVIDPRNEAQFTEALKRLLLDADLRRKMGERAAATIQAKATIQHSVQAFMQAIQLAFQHYPTR